MSGELETTRRRSVGPIWSVSLDSVLPWNGTFDGGSPFRLDQYNLVTAVQHEVWALTTSRRLDGDLSPTARHPKKSILDLAVVLSRRVLGDITGLLEDLEPVAQRQQLRQTCPVPVVVLRGVDLRVDRLANLVPCQLIAGPDDS